MSRIDRTHRVRRTFVAAVLAIAVVVTGATMSAEARSITGVELVSSAGEMSLNVTFEAGEPGDSHALYIAYDTEDKGADISSWTALQRGCNVAADATSATIPVSPLLTDAGYTVCRVFLTTSAAPYDTQLEYLRQSGTQYIDTGICPDYTTIAVMDVSLDSNSTAQQRFFAVSGEDATDLFAFDVYINGNTKSKNGPIRGISSACKDGVGDFKAACAFNSDRLLISLSAEEKHHIIITNLETSVELANKTYNTTCTATSATTLYIFAQHHVSGTTFTAKQIAKGARLYSFSMTTNSLLVCDYKPCKLGDRVGVYDSEAPSPARSSPARRSSPPRLPPPCSSPTTPGAEPPRTGATRTPGRKMAIPRHGLTATTPYSRPRTPLRLSPPT